MAYSEKKRFLAGATCPRCSAQDRVQVYSEAGKDFRECVACGFKDEMHIATSGREIETRVNRSEGEKKSETQVLQFPPLDPKD
jgi:uncharacterized metal-binding protein (TIGR02443 family)